MKNFFNSNYIDKLIEIPKFIDSFHQAEFQVTDIVHNDLYRRMNDDGLFDYNYIKRGTRGKNNPSKTNLVFLTWLMMAKDLKSFGLKIDQLTKVKNYLFKEFEIEDCINFPIDKESLLKKLEVYNFDNKFIKEELLNNISSGQFLNSIKEQSVSRMFLNLHKLMATGRDIQLVIDKEGNALFIDEFDLSKDEIEELSFEKRIVLPLKSYLCYFIGEYAPIEFLVRSRILSKNEAELLNEFRRNDIISLSIKYHEGELKSYEVREYKRITLQNKLSSVLLRKDFEDITIKAKGGNIYYSDIITRTKISK